MRKYLIILLSITLTGCGVLFNSSKYSANGDPYNAAQLREANVIIYRPSEDDSKNPYGAYIEINGKSINCLLNKNGYIAIKQKGIIALKTNGVNETSKITLQPGKIHYIRFTSNNNSLMGSISWGLVGDYKPGYFSFAEVDPIKEKAFIELTREDCRVGF